MNDKDEEKDDIELDGSDLDDSVVEEEHAQDKIKKLKDKLKEAEEKAKGYLDSWQRAQADFANLRRRDEEAKVEFVKFSRQTLIEELIPVLDSFNLALEHGNKEIKPVYDQLFSILKQNGLEELNPVGEAFDPKFHEAIAMVKTDKESEDHKILEVVQKGYILLGKIIRAAKVKVGEFSN